MSVALVTIGSKQVLGAAYLRRWSARVGAVLAVSTALLAGAATPQSPTIGDLKGRQVEIRRHATVPADPAQTRRYYEQFLQLEPGDAALRAEALRRLGDLKLEDGEFSRIEQDLASGSPLETRDAIALYQQLLAAFPGYEHNDGVLYQLARALDADGQVEAAQLTLDRLVQDYPQSRRVDEANFRRAESLFSAQRWQEAELGYRAVIAHGTAGVFFEQSLYKEGWALFKQGEHEASAASFLRVLDRQLVDAKGGLRPPDTLPRAERELVEDTFRALSLDFSYLEGAKSIDAVLANRPIPPVYRHLLYAQLGDLYMLKERYTDAADTYRAYVQRAPDSDPAPLLQQQALAAYTKGGFLQLVVEGKREFVERYSLGKPYWNGRTLESQPAVVRELNSNLRDLAQYHHALAQREKRPEEYLEAARWYRESLQQFPSAADAPQTRMLLAETLVDSGRFAQAASEYEQVAYGYLDDPQAAAAAYAAVVAYDREEAQLSGDAKVAWHDTALAAGLRFANQFPAHPETPVVLARSASDLYDRHQFAQAVAVARLLLARQPAVDDSQRRLAWGVIANAQFDAGDWVNAEGSLLQWLPLVPTTDADHATVIERLAVAVYRQGEAKQAAGDLAGATAEWLRVRDVAPSAKARLTADYDAGALLLRRQEWLPAIVVLERFRREFPTDGLQLQVTRNLATAYLESGQSGAAAREFLRIADNAAEPADARREALWRAAGLQATAGPSAAAEAALELYIKRYSTDIVLAMEARQQLADRASAAHDDKRRARWLGELISADRDAGAARTERSRSLAAAAALELAVPLRDAYNAVHLVVPLKKSLASKRVALERALKAYTAAADYAVAEVTTAATFEIGELYRQLGQELLKSERPRGLDREAREQYDLLLEEQAYPFEEKTISVFELNIARLADGFYDRAVQRTLEVLATLKAGRYGKVEDTTFFSVATGAVEPAAAQTRLESVLRADPANALALLEYGSVLRRQGQLVDAEAAYRHALALRPKDVRVQRNVAVFLDVYRQRPVEALALFERVQAARSAAGEGDDKLLNGWIAELRNRLQAKPAATTIGSPLMTEKHP